MSVSYPGFAMDIGFSQARQMDLPADSEKRQQYGGIAATEVRLTTQFRSNCETTRSAIESVHDYA